MCLSRHNDGSREVYERLPKEFDVYKVIRDDDSGGIYWSYSFQTGLNKPNITPHLVSKKDILGFNPEGSHTQEESGFGCFITQHEAERAKMSRIYMEKLGRKIGEDRGPTPKYKVIKARARKSDVIHCGTWQSQRGLAFHVKALWINSLDKVT